MLFCSLIRELPYKFAGCVHPNKQRSFKRFMCLDLCLDLLVHVRPYNQARSSSETSFLLLLLSSALCNSMEPASAERTYILHTLLFQRLRGTIQVKRTVSRKAAVEKGIGFWSSWLDGQQACRVVLARSCLS